jgi:hypothetical protein
MIYKNLNLTDEEIDRIVEESRKNRTNDAHLVEPWAVKAWYDAENDLVMVQIRNGCVFGFPPREGQGIENATPEQLAKVSIEESGGEAVHWEELDADISVPGIMFDLLNVRGWYAKWLGSATSEAKAAAARENGKKGGRPRTKAPASQRSRRSGGATSGD